MHTKKISVCFLLSCLPLPKQEGVGLAVAHRAHPECKLIICGGQHILLMRSRPPAIVATDAHLLQIDGHKNGVAQNDIVGMAVIAFAALVEILDAVVQRRAGKLWHAIYQQSVAGIICERHPADVGFVAVFLRADVGEILLGSGAVVFAHKSCCVAVDVIFVRSAAKPLQLVILSGHRPSHPKAWQLRAQRAQVDIFCLQITSCVNIRIV